MSGPFFLIGKHSQYLLHRKICYDLRICVMIVTKGHSGKVNVTGRTKLEKLCPVHIFLMKKHLEVLTYAYDLKVFNDLDRM